MTDDSHSSTHPPIPPTTEDDRFRWLRLLRSRRVGISTFWRLLGEHGSAEAALAALPGMARDAGLDDYRICPEGVIAAELASGRRHGARLLCTGDPDYPALLAQIPDAPPLLWVAGDAGILSRPMVAMVGARNASSLGLRMARRLATELGEAGLVVASGLARGIDTAVHEATLSTGTVAVMGGGVDILYPSENKSLAQEIASQGGARISEQPMGLQPLARHFPMRNRIVSGLARLTLVVEAAVKSGSLITARNAADQGRDVAAVPGHPFDARAGGCNRLIRDGAHLVRDAGDVLELLPQPARDTGARQASLDLPKPSETRRAPVPDLQDPARLHNRILDRLGPSPMAEDQLIRDLGAASGAITPVLTDLELEGRIMRQPGGLLARVG